MHQVGVLAEPAEPRASCQIALEQWSRVDVGLSLDRSPRIALHASMQLAQLRIHHVVVVVAARIARHRSTRLSSAVVEGDNDRVRRPWLREARVAPLLRAALEIVHLPGMPRVDPRIECVGRLDWSECCDTNQIEPQRESMCLRQLRQVARRI